MWANSLTAFPVGISLRFSIFLTRKRSYRTYISDSSQLRAEIFTSYLPKDPDNLPSISKDNSPLENDIALGNEKSQLETWRVCFSLEATGCWFKIHTFSLFAKWTEQRISNTWNTYGIFSNWYNLNPVI